MHSDEQLGGLTDKLCTKKLEKNSEVIKYENFNIYF